MNYDSLSELSHRFGQRLFAVFPMWEQYAHVVPGNADESPSLLVGVPQEGTARILYLSTADDEITIGFDHWHTHVGTFMGIDVERAVVMAIDIIEAFVAEDAVVKVVHRDGVWKGAGLEYLVAPSPREEQATTHVFSWKRTHDEIVEAP